MDKKDKMLIIYVTIMITLLVTIFGSVFINSFLTPFTGGDKYTPWETVELKLILSPDSYELTGPKVYDYGVVGNKQYIDARDNRYILPKTPLAKIICWLFRWRVKFAFLASLIGIVLFVLYKIKYRTKKYPVWIRTFFVLFHTCFFVIAFLGTMCVRWWGSG